MMMIVDEKAGRLVTLDLTVGEAIPQIPGTILSKDSISYRHLVSVKFCVRWRTTNDLLQGFDCMQLWEILNSPCKSAVFTSEAGA